MADTIFCSRCGTSLDAQARFCSRCGNVIVAPAPSQPAAMAAAAPVAAPPPFQPMAMSAVPAAMPPQHGAVPPAYVPQAAYPAMAPMPSVMPYAGFWMRVGAYFIDVVILFIPLLILQFIPILGIFTGIIGIWLYYALQESSEYQATFGKRALKIYVTDMQGRRISFGQASGRHFGKIISFIILGIGFMMAGFTAQKQALHDIMAGTLVKRR